MPTIGSQLVKSMKTWVKHTLSHEVWSSQGVVPFSEALQESSVPWAAVVARAVVGLVAATTSFLCLLKASVQALCADYPHIVTILRTLHFLLPTTLHLS